MKIAALLLLAGSGERFTSNIPKQFHTLDGQKVFRFALNTIKKTYPFSEIVLVSKKNYHQFMDDCSDYLIIEGGKSRQESVHLGLKALNSPDCVVIFESVRPFITEDLILEHIKMLKAGKTAINTCIPSFDTINIQKNNKINKIPSRDQFLKGQTPQSFLYKPLLNAHNKTQRCFTDDCGLMLDEGFEIDFVLGSERNIKITTDFDLKLAEFLLGTYNRFS
ncbi:MAG: Ribitol-5-phosphate cytidylyltransferase [Chlamydiia bacterium]|nr:Ribitol-5-phosphate cytidylyltransferase [Chlamydiia bacterium]